MISRILRRAAALAMRLAVAVVYIRLSKMPLQTGKSEIVSKETQVGHIVVHHDREHPSQLILPVVQAN